MGCETKEDIKELARLKKKLSKDKNNVELLFKIGMLLFDTFIDMDQARPYFEKAIKLDFKNPDLLFWFGYALYHGKCFYDEAKELFEQALSLDQSRAEFYYMMFNVLWKITGVAKSGFNYLQNTIKLQPNWLEPREQYITCLVMQNEFEEAEKELSKAYTALEMYHKNKKGPNLNTLEKYYFDSSNNNDYDLKKEELDLYKKEIEEKRKNLSPHPQKPKVK